MAVNRSVAIAGSIAQRPHNAGHAWMFLQYLLGFRQLGFDVTFIDKLTGGMLPGEREVSRRAARATRARWLSRVLRQYGFDGSYSLLLDGNEEPAGLRRSEVMARVRRAEFLLNFMGFLDDEEIMGAAPRRVFLDIDPGFGQMWNELHLADVFSGHDDFVTIAENIRFPACAVPDCGIQWLPTRQPVLLEEWPCTQEGGRNFTSIVTWRGPYAPVEYEGQVYGVRVHEFRKFAALPERTGERFEIALDIDEADRADHSLLRRNGWRVVDPARVADDLNSYRHFIQRSAAEFMVAKQMYVMTGGGWFSDRSACYLASGKPVLAQDTGFTKHYPVGDGLLSFRDLEEASEGVHRIRADWKHHSKAARDIAAEYFDSRVVLGHLLDELGVG
jgi:hypothetical protein